MIIKQIRTNPSAGDTSLTLFFSGWGMDEHPFLKYIPGDINFMMCYDYRSLAFDRTLFSPFSSVRVIAWSMGVWAASKVLAQIQLPVSEAIAVNGTPYPIDDERGIPETIFQGTLNNLNDKTLYKFRRRMCGSLKRLDEFQQNAPVRELDDLRQELIDIDAGYDRKPVNVNIWSRIYIGNSDKIFPAANQLKAWGNYQATIIDEDHFPGSLWMKLFCS